jgi:hypothetical protein
VSPRKRRLQPAPARQEKAKLLEQHNFLAFFMGGEEDDPRNATSMQSQTVPSPQLSPRKRGGEESAGLDRALARFFTASEDVAQRLSPRAPGAIQLSPRPEICLQSHLWGMIRIKSWHERVRGTAAYG